jgi:uncharacterized protein
MAIIIRIVAFLFIIYLVRRLIAGFTKSSKRAATGGGDAKAESRMVKDPMCGMYMDSRLAIKVENRSEAVYFCSEECKRQYVNKYAKEGMGTAMADQGR